MSHAPSPYWGDKYCFPKRKRGDMGVRRREDEGVRRREEKGRKGRQGRKEDRKVEGGRRMSK